MNNGATRKIKADHGGLSDILSRLHHSDHNNNTPMNNYKDNEDKEEDDIEDNDHNQGQMIQGIGLWLRVDQLIRMCNNCYFWL